MQYIFILWKNSNWAGILYLHTHDQTTNNSHEQLQKQPLEVFCKKKVFLEISQNSQQISVPESLY